ncbi:MAG: hypothetical protein IJY25_04545 [Bacilli bacterium]|nr:hypothetical protein [Bacilli bacterium]
MKEKSLLPAIGIVIYIVLSLIDRIIVSVPDYIYIPLGLIAIIIIIIGLIKDRKK